MVGPAPVSIVPRNAVSMPATPRSTSNPCAPRNSASHAAAWTSAEAELGMRVDAMRERLELAAERVGGLGEPR